MQENGKMAAKHHEILIAKPQGEPDPSGLSRNGR